MKAKSRIETAREMIANVKREMERPRLAASVRDALEADAALPAKRRPARAASA